MCIGFWCMGMGCLRFLFPYKNAAQNKTLMLQCLLRIEAFLGPRYSDDFIGFMGDGEFEPSPADEMNPYDLLQYKRAARKDIVRAYLRSVFERGVPLKERAASIRALYYCEDPGESDPRAAEKVLEIKEAVVKTLCVDLETVGEVHKAFVLVELQAKEPEFKHHLCQSIVQLRSKERSAWVREVLIYVHSKESVSGSVSAHIDTIAAGMVGMLKADMELILRRKPGNNRLDIAYDADRGVITLRKGPTLLGTVVVCPSSEWCFMYSLQVNASHIRFYQCVLMTVNALKLDLMYRMKTETEIDYRNTLKHPVEEG